MLLYCFNNNSQQQYSPQKIYTLVVVGWDQFSSVAQLWMTLCDPMNCSTPGLPVHHQLWELTQTHVHWVGDTIQPSHPLSSPSPPAFNLSQCQGLFQWVSCCIRWMKYGSFNLSISPSNEYSNPLGLTGLISLLSEIPKRLLQHHN